MRASEFASSHLFARATSGQRLDIRYDPRTNAIVFVEDDWSADGRGVATPRGVFRKQLDNGVVRKLRLRAAA